MEKQHNRGQEGAGVGVVKWIPLPVPNMCSENDALGAGAISEIFDRIRMGLERIPDQNLRFIGEDIYGASALYSTTGRSGELRASFFAQKQLAFA